MKLHYHYHISLFVFVFANKMGSAVDCVIVGGGPAGLAAAAALARLNHTSLVLDSGVYRNDKAGHLHAVLGWDHRDPAAFRAQARADFQARYPVVQIRSTTVKEVKQLSPGKFQVVDENGVEYLGRTLILAAGVRDVLPDLKGYSDCWAKGIFHCLLCHGYEERGARSAGVLAIGKAARPEAALHMACSATRLAQQVTIYTDGDETLKAHLQGALESMGKKTTKFSFDTRKISQVQMAERPEGKPSEVLVTLGDGTERLEGFLVSNISKPFPSG